MQRTGAADTVTRRIELPCDMLVSALQRHVEKLGGKLVLTIELSNRQRVSLEFRAMSIERVEWEHVQRVLRDHDNNISATARALSMHRRTLQRKLQRPPGKV